MDSRDPEVEDVKFEKEDSKVVFKFQHKGTMLIVPLVFYGSEDSGIQRLLVEFLSICFLLENVPPFDALDQARETLRRVEEWLIQQDKGMEGFVTPYAQHLHHSMPRYTGIYLMATSCPWGYRDVDDNGNYNTKYIYYKL